jgi:hypothetical protein
MAHTSVAKARVTKRWREPGSSGTQEVDVSEKPVLDKLSEFLDPGQEVEYYVRSPYSPTYFIREFDEEGALLDEVRVVGGGILVKGDTSFMVRKEGFSEFLDRLLEEHLPQRKRQKLSLIERLLRPRTAH